MGCTVSGFLSIYKVYQAWFLSQSKREKPGNEVGRSSWILHVNALTEKAWEDATGTGNISSKLGIKQTVFVEES